MAKAKPQAPAERRAGGDHNAKPHANGANGAVAAARARWERETYRPTANGTPERQTDFRTLSGLPLKAIYTPDDVRDAGAEWLGHPGEFPFTRGV